jgi:hypothetical protein
VLPYGVASRPGQLAVQKRLAEFGLRTTIVAKNIGYELRCADPIPFDLEYTRDLGYCAAKYVLNDGNAAMITLQGGTFVPIPFREMLDHDSGRAKIRLVDAHSARYAIARRYMIRLRRDDFTLELEGAPEDVQRLAQQANGLEGVAARAQGGRTLALRVSDRRSRAEALADVLKLVGSGSLVLAAIHSGYNETENAYLQLLQEDQAHGFQRFDLDAPHPADAVPGDPPA